MGDDPGQTRRIDANAVIACEFEPGEHVGDWVVEASIATGGFGRVYQVAHVHSQRPGALKVLHPHLVTSPELAARLAREAAIIAQLRHPSIVGLLDAGVTQVGAPFLVMELLRGTDLGAVIDARGRFELAECLRVLEPLCAAVDVAHRAGVVHRDIKASNVLVCDGGARVVLVDFGIAKLLEGGPAELTASRQALGTPASMAPEQIRGEPVDARTDVYALGALAYHLLTGRTPFADASVTMSQYLHLHAARPRPSAHAPLAPAIDEVVTRAMATEPARRPADALALFAALRAAVVAGPSATTQAITGAAVSVRASCDGVDLDDAILDDLDAVLPLVEPIAVAAGFAYLRELGDAWVFVGEGLDAAAAATTAAAMTAALATRPTRHPLVTVALATREGDASIRGGELVGGVLADPASW
ncbi:MAG: serine/threonine-protein kinase [Kofleriaceae bacterium]